MLVLQHGGELLHFQRGGTVAAVHVARHAEQDQVYFLLANDFLQSNEKIRERFRRE